MALRFFSINSGSGGTGDILWRFNGGAAPDNIELNTGNGVTGINAIYPGDRFLKLILGNSFPAGDLGNVADNSNTGLLAVSGVLKNGIDDYRPTLAALQGADQIIVDIDILNNDFSVQNTKGVFYSIQRNQSNSILAYVIDTNSNNATSLDQNLTEHSETIFEAGVIVAKCKTDNSGFDFMGASAVRVFKIGIDGKILTNQMQPPTALTTVSKQLPVYDESGILQGYIEVKTV